MADEENFLMHDSPIQLRTENIPWGIKFHNEVGDDVGHLSFDSQGQLQFEGETDRSAEIFFTAVVRANNQEMEDMRELAKLGYAVVKDFSPNVGQCVLQDYGAYNDFLMKARAEFGDDEESEG